jgi:hypothetical protein
MAVVIGEESKEQRAKGKERGRKRKQRRAES